MMELSMCLNIYSGAMKSYKYLLCLSKDRVSAFNLFSGKFPQRHFLQINLEVKTKRGIRD
jgi:hypothetical protein